MIFEKKLNIYNREMIDKILNQNSMLEIILAILIVGILVLFGIGLFSVNSSDIDHLIPI